MARLQGSQLLPQAPRAPYLHLLGSADLGVWTEATEPLPWGLTPMYSTL